MSCSDGMRIATLASLMAPSVERVIVDTTGLTGNWDLDLAFVNQVREANGDGPSLFTDVIVIDRLERPTPD